MMNQTIVGTFGTAAQAQQAAQKLAAAGFGADAVDVSHANHAADAGGRTAHRAEEGISGFFSALFGGAEDEAAQRYQLAAQSTGASVSVHCHSAEQAQQAAQLLGEAGAAEVAERAATTGYPSPSPATSQPAAPARADGLTAAIEGNLHVGQQDEQTGGAGLRAEPAAGQRLPADRPALAVEFRAFEEGQIELIELAERAVVVKEAYVVEEVSLDKQVTEREETLRDTVRSTEVDVEQLPGATAPAGTSPSHPARSNS